MLKTNQQIQTMSGDRITSGQYRGYRLTARSSSKPGYGWFEGGRGQDNHVFLRFAPGEKKEDPKPSAPPVAAHHATHAPTDPFAGLPMFPKPPTPPKPETMPVPDAAEVRWKKERDAAMRRNGRQATILLTSNHLN